MGSMGDLSGFGFWMFIAAVVVGLVGALLLGVHSLYRRVLH